ncbi:MAG: hypothetical protein HC771_07180 [Synechococcales cyanobacterium CRU_2_2]|nr:hypothetical protein [Synechococcales cyanobacterium CRU_2_2]
MNFNTPALLFGLILLVAAIGLFIFGRLKPELQRDSDSVYAIIGVICALILFGSAFDLSLGMSFQQLLMIGSLIALMWENIQARQPKGLAARRGGALDGVRGWAGGDPARRNAPRVDDDRSMGNIYRYEPEPSDYDRVEDPSRRDQRRLRGSEPPRRGYDDGYDEPRRERPPVQRPRPSLNDADRSAERPRARAEFDEFDERPAPSRSRPQQSDDWDLPRRDRSRPPEDAPPPRRRPRSGSMDGSPVGDLGDSSEPSSTNRPRSGVDRSTGPSLERGMERPPIDRPLGDRLGGRQPLDRPVAERPPMERPPTERPPTGRPPLERSRGTRPSINPGNQPPQEPPSNGDYVNFKPLNPPPADEMDNSSNFDD